VNWIGKIERWEKRDGIEGSIVKYRKEGERRTIEKLDSSIT